MPQNFLKLNKDKTEIIAFGSKHSSSLLQSQLGPLSLNLEQAAKNLGVMFDAELCFDAQVKSTVKSCFFQLKTISKIRSFYPILTYTRFYMLLSSLTWTTAMDCLRESVRAPSKNSNCRMLLPEFQQEPENITT